MKLKLLAAALLAGAAFSASADNNSYAITLGVTTDFDDIGTVLNGGSDTITFTGLPTGMYHVLLDYSTVDITLTSATLNGAGATFSQSSPSGSWNLTVFELNTNSPFTLVLTGSVNPAMPGMPAPSPSYGGHIKVTAVPEPTTYGMMLGGLGLLGLAARRKKQS